MVVVVVVSGQWSVGGGVVEIGSGVDFSLLRPIDAGIPSNSVRATETVGHWLIIITPTYLLGYVSVLPTHGDAGRCLAPPYYPQVPPAQRCGGSLCPPPVEEDRHAHRSTVYHHGRMHNMPLLNASFSFTS